MSVAGPDQGGVEGGDGPAEVEGRLGVRQVVAGTATGTAAGGEDHLLAEVLLRVPRPGGGTVLMRAEFLMAKVGSPPSCMSPPVLTCREMCPCWERPRLDCRISGDTSAPCWLPGSSLPTWGPPAAPCTS